MRTIFFVAAIAAMMLIPLSASAQDVDPQLDMELSGQLPLRQADRPITLTEGTLRADADLLFIDGVGDLNVNLNVGAGFGISDDLEVGATVLPLAISPDFDYGNPSLYARFRFLPGDLEVGAEARVVLPVQEGSDFAVGVGLPVRFHADAIRIDTGAFVNLTFASDVVVGLGVPLELRFSLDENLYFGGRTGFNIATFDAAGDSIFVPLGALAGYTVAQGSHPLVDIEAGFTFPLFVNSFGGDAISTDFWVLNVGGRFYVDVM